MTLWVLENCHATTLNQQGNDIIHLDGFCTFCEQPVELVLTPNQFRAASSGKLDDIPSHSERELLISGLCFKCQNDIFSGDLENRNIQEYGTSAEKAFVTNATARSVAFYAMAYLNHQGYDEKRIRELRSELSLENLAQKHFTIEEVLSSFERQSAFFLNLYQQLTEGEFLRFAESLANSMTFHKVFQRYKSVYELMQRFYRTVFHTSLECDWMRNDYQEEAFHANTGVFYESVARKKENYYTINVDYLRAFHMRPCKKCLSLNRGSLQT